MSIQIRHAEAAERFAGWLTANLDFSRLGQAGVAAAYSIHAGGKRFRPFLAMEVCATAGGDVEQVLPLAAAIELIHTYSLIHDDLPAMDDDDLRRGNPTCHKVYGEALAILAGDGLQALAFELILAAPGLDATKARRAALLIAQSAGFEGMVGGQAEDMAGEGQQLSRAELEGMHRRKTGALIAAAARAGAIAAGCEPEVEDLFGRFGERLGLLFQIADDLLDATETADVLGKTAGKDAVQGKATFVTLLGLDGTRAALHEEQQNCSCILREIPYNSTRLTELTGFVAERKG